MYAQRGESPITNTQKSLVLSALNFRQKGNPEWTTGVAQQLRQAEFWLKESDTGAPSLEQDHRTMWKLNGLQSGWDEASEDVEEHSRQMGENAQRSGFGLSNWEAAMVKTQRARGIEV